MRRGRARGTGMKAKRRSKLKVTAVALAALALVNVLAMVAFTRSTTPPQPGSSLAGKLIIPPEDETARTSPAALTPDELSDLKKSSASEVTEEQVLRMQRQAAAIAPAATRHRVGWKQLGPYNIGGRMTDVVADRFTANTRVRGGRQRRHLEDAPTAAPTGRRSGPTRTCRPMGAFAQAPDGTLWAGTGEANPPGGGLTYFGDGIYKSTDNGATWTNMGLREQRRDRSHRGRPDELQPRVRRGRGPHRPLGRASAASTAPRTPARPGSAWSPRRRR